MALAGSTVSQAVKLARAILNSPDGIKALASLARALYALSPEDVRVINPKSIKCRECLRSVQESISTSTATKGTVENVHVQNSQQQPLQPPTSFNLIDNNCQLFLDRDGEWRGELWDRQAAKQYVALVTAEWPDVLIDESLQWPTNFANVERRPWGYADHDDAGFAPHKFLVSLNAASGIPYLVAPNGLARRVEPKAMCETITGAPNPNARISGKSLKITNSTPATNFPLPTDGAELEYYRLPLLCGVDPELEEDIAQQESERLSNTSRSQIEVVSPYS
ncbi:hypothetical protein KEM54_000995 [Ascosphaera aggregata]|nr:hypothetical protein KEM54_000995 [Ascosphaera aggregata]